MKTKNLFTTAFIFSFMLFVSACTTTGHERGAGAYAADAEITTKVKAKLLAEKDIKSFDINVETFDGVVQLSGFVNSQMQIDKAIEIANSVNGVKQIKNDLIHKPK